MQLVTKTLRSVPKLWIIIFLLLQNELLRFGELKNIIQGITQRMLTQQLRELENDKVVHRKVYAEVPPRVEYSLTEYGRSLEPIMVAMRDWGAEHMNVKCKG